MEILEIGLTDEEKLFLISGKSHRGSKYLTIPRTKINTQKLKNWARDRRNPGFIEFKYNDVEYLSQVTHIVESEKTPRNSMHRGKKVAMKNGCFLLYLGKCQSKDWMNQNYIKSKPKPETDQNQTDV